MSRQPRYAVSPGRWKIEQERLRLDPRQRPPEVSTSGRITDVVTDLVRQVGLEERMWEQTLLAEWPRLVGEQVARRSRPGRMYRKVLTVFVSNSAWLGELSRYGQQQMLDNIQKRFGSDRIQSLRLQLDPDQAPAPRRPGATPAG
jgi:predicted nucleic acid-binding Zn ribbon protein